MVSVDLLASVNHLLNWLAPAFFMALGMVSCARIFKMNQGAVLGYKAQIAINFAVGCLALLAGLWWLGRDGKMATYALLVLSSALCQWVLSKAWR